WIVDPLDGTREYVEPLRDDWAVHVALAIDGVPVVGAVALPGRALVLSTGADLPAPEVPTQPRRPRLLVSRTRPPAQAVELARRMDAELVPMGSAGAKAMAVVLGEADVYVHAGGQYEWDSAAPAAVALAAGFHASRCDGSPLTYDRPDAWLPDLVICRPDLAPQVLALWHDIQ
ncbi:MAG TPA: inositol monophosphatase family protein, partial [Ilumatobacteraceae bacterium]|nr:inositol monophosphatase family protein [Ilumatobacteraceae bacterium]